MDIIFAGAAAYEFVNVPNLSTSTGTFDPTHVEGAIQKTSYANQATALFFKEPVAEELWLHAKVFFGASVQTATSGAPIFGFSSSGSDLHSGIVAGNGTIKFGYTGGEININSFVPRETLCDVDIHVFQAGSRRAMELYINGGKVADYRPTVNWTIPQRIILGGLGITANFYSEVVVTEGNSPTLAMRLHSKRPDAALPGLNTFDSGYWGSLANGLLTDGVITTEDGARLTGGFQAYTGPASPLGIRAVVHSARYLKNGTLLNLKGQLRINDVNYDNPDAEFDDGNRLLSIWDKNPKTNAPFIVSDFAGMQGGFYTAL